MNALASFGPRGRPGASDAATSLAVVDGQTRWSRHQLDDRANAVASGLVRAGVAPGARVALLAVPSAAAIAALHGIARIGGAVVPLGVRLTDTELAVAAEVTDPHVVVHGSSFGAAAAGLGRPALALDELMDKPGPRQPSAAPPSDPASPAAVVLTSGTTGRPKAVVLSGAALIASAEAWLAALPPATGWLLALGLNHVAGLGVVRRADRSRVPLVVLPRSDAAEIAAALADDPAPSHVSLVPTTLSRLLDAVATGPAPSTLRAVLVGGGPIPPELVARAIEAGWPIVPTYGLSEAGSGVTALPTPEASHHPGSAGRPLPGVEVRIGEPDEDGVGEILVASPACFTGYLGDPVATGAAFTDGHWLRTGDLGRLDGDGRLEVVDRRTDRIVRGGENVSPSEVEAVLRDHPAIADAAVVARRDAIFGHVPVAAVVLRKGRGDPADDDLARFCRARLAAFKVPAAFIRIDALPRTGSGKLRRAQLRASLEDRAVAEPSPRDCRLARPGGVDLVWRNLGSGQVHLLLLHGTLSTAAQLGRLARALADTGAFTVHAVDRRGSGRSRLTEPVPLEVDVHVADLAAILDVEGCPAAVLVGVSFGGVVALEFAAREPDRALAVVAYEPPYGPLADAATQRAFTAVATATVRAHRASGAAGAAEAFMRGVAGGGAWDRLPDRARVFLADEGDSAYVDAGLLGLDPVGLRRIRVPAVILTGGASDPFYAPIADALVGCVPGARRQALPDSTHASPINEPAPVVEAVMSALTAAGVIHPASPGGAAGEPGA